MFNDPHIKFSDSRFTLEDFLNLPDLPSVELNIEDANYSENLQSYMTGELAGVQFNDLHTTWARFLMPVHGTSIERALSVIEDNAIYSFRSVEDEHPDVQQQRLLNATDQLDIQIGMDKFVFTNVGRVNPFDIQDVYFCFTTELGEKADSFVALREIVHFGALVSPEAAKWRELALAPEQIDVATLNRRATAEFLKNLFSFADFRDEIFPRFLSKHFGDQLAGFSVDLLYPGTEPEVQVLEDEATIINSWDGPQLCIPGQIDFADLQPSILITNTDPSCLQRIKTSGFPAERIFTVSEALDTYEQTFRGLDYTSPEHRYKIVNLALRDMCLMACNNVAGESFRDSMNGFRERV